MGRIGVSPVSIEPSSNENTPPEEADPNGNEAGTSGIGNPGDVDQDSGADAEDADRLQEVISAQAAFDESLYQMLQISRSGTSEADVFQCLEDGLRSAVRVLDANDGAILARDEDSDELVFVITEGEVPPEQLAWTRLPKGKGIANWVTQTRRPTIVNDVASDERFFDAIDDAHTFRTRSLIAVPLIHDREVLGVLEVLNKKNDAFFTAADQNRLVLLGHFISRLLHKLRYQLEE